LTQEEWDEGYVGLYAPGQRMNDPQSDQISYSSHPNTFTLKLGHNVILLLVEMKAASGKDYAAHVIRPAKVIPTILVTVSYTPLLMSKLRLRRYLMRMKEWWIRTQRVGQRLIVVLM
jgi:hypothetical protein